MPVVAAGIVVIVAVVGYVQLIPIHHVERTRLSRLVVTAPGAGFKVKPTSSTQVAASSSPFAAVKAAGKRSPNSTGAYSIQWTAPTSGQGASLLASLMPSVSDAEAVQAEAVKAYLAATSLKSQSYKLQGALSVRRCQTPRRPPSCRHLQRCIRGSPWWCFELTESSSSRSYSSPGRRWPGASAVALTRAEYLHVRRLGSGFSLTVTTWPLVASLVYGGVSVAIVAVLLLGPMSVRRTCQRQLLAREEAVRRDLRGRGRKIAKHQAVRRR